MSGPEFVVPIQANHVRSALTIARQDQDSFRKTEISWLEENNPFLWNHIRELFTVTVQFKGIDTGYAILLGDNLGSRAVRLCINEIGGNVNVLVQELMFFHNITGVI